MATLRAALVVRKQLEELESVGVTTAGGREADDPAFERLMDRLNVEAHIDAQIQKRVGGTFWRVLEEKYPAGSVVKARVLRVGTPFTFVVLDEDVNGFFLDSDISWSDDIEPRERFKRGDEIEAKVLRIDADLESVMLGIRQLTEAPPLPADSKVEGEDEPSVA